MPATRARLLSLLLTIFVGCSLAASTLAHPLPAKAEIALEVALAGLPDGQVCGHDSSGKPACPGQDCTTCMGASAPDAPPPAMPLPARLVTMWRLSLPGPDAPVKDRRWLVGESRGPPVI